MLPCGALRKFYSPDEAEPGTGLGSRALGLGSRVVTGFAVFGGVDLVPFQDLGFDEQHFLNSVLQNCSSKRCLKNKTKPKAEQKGKKSKRAVEDDVP